MNTLAPSSLIGSSSYLQVTRTSITSQTSSKFDQIRAWRPCSAELAALELLKKSVTYLRTSQKYLMTCWLSYERSLPFGLLVLLKFSLPMEAPHELSPSIPEKKIFDFYHIWAWWPSWSCDQHHVHGFSFPYT